MRSSRTLDYESSARPSCKLPSDPGATLDLDMRLFLALFCGVLEEIRNLDSEELKQRWWLIKSTLTNLNVCFITLLIMRSKEVVNNEIERRMCIHQKRRNWKLIYF